VEHRRGLPDLGELAPSAMTSVVLAEILALASREGRVCPKPAAWNRLYDLLPNKRRDGYGFIPAAPFMLDAWQETSDEQKHHRLVEHLQWADSHGALAAVRALLSKLAEEEWHHVGE
jgi:hypothetical protein